MADVETSVPLTRDMFMDHLPEVCDMMAALFRRSLPHLLPSHRGSDEVLRWARMLEIDRDALSDWLVDLAVAEFEIPRRFRTGLTPDGLVWHMFHEGDSFSNIRDIRTEAAA